MTRATPSAILVVDDCDNDFQLLLRSVKVVGLPNPIHCVDTVIRAICYLKGEGEFSDRQRYPMASLVLLDMMLGREDGLDVLRWIRSQPDMWGVIVVAVSSIANPALMERAYRLGANSFLVKPFGGEAMNDMVKALHHYWVTMNRT